jgi:hypothetical protein
MVWQCYPEKDVAGSSGGVICETKLNVSTVESSLDRHFHGSIHKNVGYRFVKVKHWINAWFASQLDLLQGQQIRIC